MSAQYHMVYHDVHIYNDWETRNTNNILQTKKTQLSDIYTPYIKEHLPTLLKG